MRRAVIDTNVVISSFFGGPPRAIIDLWRSGKLMLCISDEILAEYFEVLARHRKVKEESHELVALLTERKNALLVTPARRFQGVSANPDDDKFLDCAVAAHADAIVSGDRHLLALGSFRGIPILSPAEFLASARGESALGHKGH